ncbi:MAG: amino acid adenylation domain-containing protein, partial [Acidobacteriota bacterium]
MSRFSKRIFDLSAKKREVLDRLLEIDGFAPMELTKIPRRKDIGVIPLSFAQQRLWFMSQWEAGNPSYNLPYFVHFRGTLNIAALERSFNEIIHRHEILRTTFTIISGQAVQIIVPALALNMSIIDLQELDKELKEIETAQLASQQARQPFDLVNGPLLRSILLRLSEQEHILLLSLHHIVSDGWSRGILIRELAALYEAFSIGNPSPLSELPIQYADFAIWQREWLNGEILQKQLAYWKEKLAGELPILELPTDHPRPALQTANGAHYFFTLAKQVTESLKSFSAQHDVTLFMILLAALKALLYRYTGQADILIGSPIANRNRVEIEGLIGFFVNTIVLRTSITGEMNFQELVKKVQQTALEAYANQDLPFEKLLEELQPKRDLSRSPLFQVVFILENAPTQALKLPGLSLEILEIDSKTAKCELMLLLEESRGDLKGFLEYNTDLFEPDTIARLISHLQTLLAAVAINPQQRIAQIQLLTEIECQQLLVEWNNTTIEYPYDKCIHKLFEEQVAYTPTAIAITFKQQQLSYQELNARANQLAHYLISLGIQPEMLVGVCLDRSLEMIVALLGILKVGGVYLPLDPSYPKDRLAFMLADAQVDILLTEEKLIGQLSGYDVQLICMDKDWQLITQHSTEKVVCDVESDNLCYVIYTSGSTGKPKGVLIEHQGLSNLVQQQTKTFQLDRESRVLQFASLSFDASIFEMVMSLSCGGRLYLESKEQLLPGPDLLEFLQRESITIVTLTPSALAVLPEGELAELETVIVAGEECRAELVARWSVGRRFYNLYGPTETTIWATMARCEVVKGKPSIGRPIANTQVYILDKELQPAPIGVAGELCIGGVGLARGYLNRADLTADKFIPNPFSSETGTRLYRTGDLARYLPDGNIEYLGRIDQQVKLRGYRIELAEIETVLKQHSLVKDAIVIAREDEPGEKRLVAYLVAETGASVTATECQAHLRERLPEYMIPSHCVMLERMPLTTSGKVDRKALPMPARVRSELGQEYVAARNGIEEILVGIYAEVLKLERVGIHDNFFELGGHSLLATQLMSRVRDTFRIEIALRNLFEYPTVAGLAKKLESLNEERVGLAAPSIGRVNRDQAIPLSFAQQRLWFLDQFEPGSAVYNVLGAINLVGNLNVVILARSINEIVRRHEVLRTNFAISNGEPIQQIIEQLKLQLAVVDLIEISSTVSIETGRLIIEESAKPFDLSIGPLLRVKLLRTKIDEHILLFTMHHIVSDGWSMGVLIKEIAALYQAYLSGKPSPLEELPIQYADYAAWQREWLQAEVLAKQIEYWRQQLGNEHEALILPTDRPRPAVQSYRGARYRFALSEELSAKLKELGRRKGVTLFMTLLSALDVLLYRYSGQVDISVGTPIANRNRTEIENLIGFFINTLVMRVELSGKLSFAQLLGRVREVTLGAYGHQDVPFEKIVEELQPERDLSRSPLFQVVLTLQNTPMASLELPELTLNTIPVENQTAKFDLSVILIETETGLSGNWRYSTDLFDETTIDRMAGHLTRLLAAVVENAELRLWDLPLLSEIERQQLLVEWNNTFVEYDNAICLHQLFEAQVRQTPDAVAVVFEQD